MYLKIFSSGLGGGGSISYNVFGAYIVSLTVAIKYERFLKAIHNYSILSITPYDSWK